jgi:hypothetical protein
MAVQLQAANEGIGRLHHAQCRRGRSHVTTTRPPALGWFLQWFDPQTDELVGEQLLGGVTLDQLHHLFAGTSLDDLMTLSIPVTHAHAAGLGTHLAQRIDPDRYDSFLTASPRPTTSATGLLSRHPESPNTPAAHPNGLIGAPATRPGAVAPVAGRPHGRDRFRMTRWPRPCARGGPSCRSTHPRRARGTSASQPSVPARVAALAPSRASRARRWARLLVGPCRPPPGIRHLGRGPGDSNPGVEYGWRDKEPDSEMLRGCPG